MFFTELSFPQAEESHQKDSQFSTKEDASMLTESNETQMDENLNPVNLPRGSQIRQEKMAKG